MTKFRVAEISLFEREVTLRLPFRFGAATLTQCPQAFVRARLVFANGQGAIGAAAELMIPKWFDKSPRKSNAQNIEDLRTVLRAAAAAYTAQSELRTAFAHSAMHYRELVDEAIKRGSNPLTGNYGPALIDRAILDALCKSQTLSIYDATRCNLPGIDVKSLTPDLEGFDLARFLEHIRPKSRVAVRHTIGLLDPITPSDLVCRLDDGLPETLEEVIGAYGQRYFKLKLRGDPVADLERMLQVTAVLDRLRHNYAVTLDGNEQYAEVETLVALWRAVEAHPKLRRFSASVLSFEQPLSRDRALEQPVAALARCRPVIIDESDATYEAFLQACRLGYQGVSSKSCKGFYRSVLNAARCAQWNALNDGNAYFLSAEDLTMQAGLAVQQDLALVNVLGLTHVERNGYHYVNGFAGAGAGESEQRRFLSAHPDLYECGDDVVRLAIREGTVGLNSLDCVGFASAADPDWDRLGEML